MNDISHILYFRPSANPSASVPLGGRSVGHYIVDAKHHEQRMVKDFFQFFWGIEGTGEFKIGRQALLLHPEEVLFLKHGIQLKHCLGDAGNDGAVLRQQVGGDRLAHFGP